MDASEAGTWGKMQKTVGTMEVFHRALHLDPQWQKL